MRNEGNVDVRGDMVQNSGVSCVRILTHAFAEMGTGWTSERVSGRFLNSHRNPIVERSTELFEQSVQNKTGP